MSGEQLFKPLRLGHNTLKHRMVMAPLTRFRSTEDHVPGPHVREYYEQRAAVPGTLIITEATFISPWASGYDNVPGIWNEVQVKAWREVTDAVHARGSFIYCQLWALGRAAVQEILTKMGGYVVVSSSSVAMDSDHAMPKEMTHEDIQTFIKAYAHAARCAIDAGFDGVEIHGANGYLIDQFWQDNVNRRTDEYGGSIEKRARFGLEVTKAVIDALDGDSQKVGIRLSPWSTFQGMRMTDPLPQFSYIVEQLKRLDLAYLHLVESRTAGHVDNAEYKTITGLNDELVKVWGTQAPVLLAGGFDADKAKKAVDELYTAENVCIVFGRYFLSTPDLPFRVQNGIDLNPYNRKTFYKALSPEGYVDYPFSKEWLANESRL